MPKTEKHITNGMSAGSSIKLNKAGSAASRKSPDHKKAIAARVKEMHNHLSSAGVSKEEANEIVKSVIKTGQIPQKLNPSIQGVAKKLYLAATGNKVTAGAQKAVKDKPKTARTLKAWQRSLVERLQENLLHPGNEKTDSIMDKVSFTLKAYHQALTNVSKMSNANLSEADRTDITTDIKMIDGVIDSGSSAEQLKAVAMIFKTVARFLSVQPVATVDNKLFSNFQEILSFGSVEADQASVIGGSPEDARPEPDFTFKVALHALPITTRLIQKLNDLGVSSSITDELAMYAPGFTHDGSVDKAGLGNIDSELSWPTSVPEDYLGPKVYDPIIEDLISFMREVKDLVIDKKARTVTIFDDETKTIPSNPMDVAFKLWMYLTMNALWKLMLENTIGIEDIILSQMQLDLSRYKSSTPHDLFNIFLLSNNNVVNIDHENINALFKRTDIAYNKAVYDFLKPAYKEMRYTFQSPHLSYYLGDSKVGDHIFTIRVVPFLVLPYDIRIGNLDETSSPIITGNALYNTVYVENGSVDEVTNVKKDLDVNFTNGLALQTMYLHDLGTVANQDRLVELMSDKRLTVDMNLYFSTSASGYNVFRDTMSVDNLGNKGVQVAANPTSEAESAFYLESDALDDTDGVFNRIAAHLGDHCSQWSYALLKTYKKFIAKKFSSYRKMDRFLNWTLGIPNHKMIGYTEKLQGRSSSENALSKSIDYKSAFSLVTLRDASGFTYIHREDGTYPVYVAKSDDDTKMIIRLTNLIGQKNVKKESVKKLIGKKIDHIPWPKANGVHLREDAFTGKTGYAIGTLTEDQDFMFDNSQIIELYKPRVVFYNKTHYATVPVLAAGNTTLGQSLKDDNYNFEHFGTNLKALLSAILDKKQFEDEVIMEDIIDSIFTDEILAKYQWNVTVPITKDIANFGYLEDSRTHYNNEVNENLMKIFGVKIMPKKSAGSITFGTFGKTGLVGNVKDGALVVSDEDFYPPTIDIENI